MVVEPSVSDLLTDILEENVYDVYLLGEETNNDRSLRTLEVATQGTADSEPSVKTYWFSVPNNWSDAELKKIAFESLQAIS
jgi:hypothetical protein